MRSARRRGILNSVSSFSPLSLNPALWLDAADTFTIIETSGSVSQWNDKSGNGRHVSQAVGANQPTTGTQTQNGLNVLNFDGNDVLVGGTTPVLFADSTTPFEVHAFARWSGTNSGTIVSQNISGTENLRQFQLLRQGVTGTVLAIVARGANRLSSRTNLDGRAAWAAYQWNGTTGTIRDGNTTNNAAPGAAAAESGALIKIGARSNGSTTNEAFYMNGIIGEVLIFDRALTTDERNDLGNYLATKWSITL
jgi:hypothetical protein